MLELKLNITESKILYSYKNNGNIILMLCQEDNIIEAKISVRYEKSRNKLNLLSFFNSGLDKSLKLKEIFLQNRQNLSIMAMRCLF
jgi:hypothetical protein